jgi:hypothetical protein
MPLITIGRLRPRHDQERMLPLPDSSAKLRRAGLIAGIGYTGEKSAAQQSGGAANTLLQAQAS